MTSGAHDINGVYVGYWFPPGTEVLDAVRAVSSRINATSRGTTLEILSAETESPQWEARQREFDGLLDSALKILQATGFGADDLRACGGQLELRIHLYAEKGMAGLFISNSVLQAWLRLGADLFLDA